MQQLSVASLQQQNRGETGGPRVCGGCAEQLVGDRAQDTGPSQPPIPLHVKKGEHLSPRPGFTQDCVSYAVVH